MKVFISDLHLSQDTPELTALLLRFLKELRSVSELYVLGDLFEAWVGDEDMIPYSEVVQAFHEFSQQTPLYFMVGNRDFLLGKAFAKASGARLLTEPSIFAWGKHRLALCHGDHLCTLDQTYQRYRKIVRNPFIQKVFLNLPIALRRKIARKMRAQSTYHNKTSRQTILDVDLKAVQHLFQETQATLLIHGHTHRQAIHTVEVSQGSAHRIVLGDWHDQAGSALFLEDSGEFYFKEIS